MSGLTLGSLFDGIGVFPLAASRCDIRPLWASEIEAAPISITRRHFPDMAHLGDITKLDGGAIPPVHVLTFGSPCQNLSQIGRREGLDGTKSGLFFHAIRIIQEMRKATNDLYPVISVWENVMGAFSSNDRMDFRAVLSAFNAADVPMPASGRWAGAGMVRGGTPDLAWRLMDAQYWASMSRHARSGVPPRTIPAPAHLPEAGIGTSAALNADSTALKSIRSFEENAPMTFSQTEITGYRSLVAFLIS